MTVVKKAWRMLTSKEKKILKKSFHLQEEKEAVMCFGTGSKKYTPSRGYFQNWR